MYRREGGPIVHRFCLALALLLLASCDRSSPEILWDDWGVPHVYAQDDAGLFEAFGYAQALSHGELILRLYAQARGSAAAIYGPEFLPSDRYVRTMGIPDRAEGWYARQSGAFRADLDAFAAGINRYGREHAEALSPEAKAVLPVTGTDLLAHAQRVVHFAFVYSEEEMEGSFEAIEKERGSNMWAVAPNRSANGSAMLLANPHLPWSDFYLFYEAELNGPGTHVYGTTLVGFPVLAIAFNDQLGWSHTVNTYDGADTYRVTKSGDGYLLDGKIEPFEERAETIRVREADGSERSEELVVRRTVHGPVIHETDGEALAVRVAGLDQPGMLEQWWEMGHATSFDQFEAAVRKLQIPMFNIIYADRTGHIYYLYGGRVPERSRGDFAWWSGVVPGDTSELLWTRTLDYDHLPHILDPPNGWLQNANDPPWTVTVPITLSPEDFPAYLAPRGMSFRPQRSAHMVSSDDSITFEEMIGYKHDSHMELADRILDDLIPLAETRGTPLARRAAEVFSRWDRRADAASRGAMLFVEWARRWVEAAGGPEAAFTTPWSPDDAINTPDGIADPALALEQLDAASAAVEKQYGALDVPWGDVVRLRYAGKNLPANGAPGPFGVFRAAYFGPPDSDGKRPVVGGDTFYAVVEFGDPVRAKVLTAYGNSTDPASKHRGDQLELFARKEMRDALLTRTAVEEHLEERTTLR
jgi:acyl-homoserine-lactone acylase